MPNNPKPITSEKKAVEIFRKKFVGGKNADPATFEYRVYRNIEDFILQVFQSAYSQGEQAAANQIASDCQDITQIIAERQPDGTTKNVEAILPDDFVKLLEAKYLSGEDKKI